MAKKKSTGKKAAGIGLGVAAALAAGAYFLYGSKEGAKRRAKIKGWMLKAKGEVLERLEKAKEVNQKTYHKIVDDVAKKYKGLTNVDLKELEGLKKDMKKHWKNIQKQISEGEKKSGRKKA